MTTLLLDTHAFIWWARGDARLRPSWIEPIIDSANTVLFSAASTWELETKKRGGRLSFHKDVADVAQEFGFELLSISVAHATRAGSLEWEHRDPFDRMLVAQAQLESSTIVTADEAILSAPGVKVLA